jgi:protein TonB
VKESSLRPIGIIASIGIHAALLLIGGATLIQQKATYGMQEAASTQVDLVASAPEEKVSSVPALVQPKPDDMARPKRKEKKTLTVKKAVAETPQQAPSAPSIPAASSPSGSKGVVSAKPDYMRNPPPPYPAEARAAHQEGVVILMVEVNASGGAEDVRVKQSSGYRSLDQAALIAVKTWTFHPGTTDGVPVRSEVEVPVRFRLQGSE